MKKLTVLAAVIMIATATQAQSETVVKNEINALRIEKKSERKQLRKLEGKDVSTIAEARFAGDFGNLPIISSERSGAYDKFTFKQDGRITTAYYDATATLVGTTQLRTLADLPGNARKTIARLYKGYTPGDVIFYDDNEANETDMILYNDQFDDEDSYFVELSKDDKKIVVQVLMDGDVRFFTTLCSANHCGAFFMSRLPIFANLSRPIQLCLYYPASLIRSIEITDWISSAHWLFQWSGSCIAYRRSFILKYLIYGISAWEGLTSSFHLADF